MYNTDHIYKDIAEQVEKIFDTSNFEIGRPLPIRKNKKVIGLMKDELGGQIMKKNFGTSKGLIYKKKLNAII